MGLLSRLHEAAEPWWVCRFAVPLGWDYLSPPLEVQLLESETVPEVSLKHPWAFLCSRSGVPLMPHGMEVTLASPWTWEKSLLRVTVGWGDTLLGMRGSRPSLLPLSPDCQVLTGAASLLEVGCPLWVGPPVVLDCPGVRLVAPLAAVSSFPCVPCMGLPGVTGTDAGGALSSVVDTNETGGGTSSVGSSARFSVE